MAATLLPRLAQGAPPELGGPATKQPPPLVIYLNYDGVSLNEPPIGGSDDARLNNSTICGSVVQPFGEGAKRDASIQATRADWEAFNVHVVTERPAAGDYVMNVVGLSECGGEGTNGVAVVDCADTNPNNVSFTFAGIDGSESAEDIASVNSQEVAHTLGLDHVDHPNAVMSSTGFEGDQSFRDECLPLTGGQCPEQHAMHCPGGQQNSYAELLGMFGPAEADLEPPTVELIAPDDGHTVAPNTDVNVEADATDEVGVAEVELLLDGTPVDMPRTQAPYTWTLQLSDAGTHTLQATALDAAGNVGTSASLTLVVGDPSSPDSGGGDDDDDDEPTGGDGASGGPSVDTLGEDREAEGCACAARGSSPTTLFAGLGLLWLAGVTRRRRGARA